MLLGATPLAAQTYTTPRIRIIPNGGAYAYGAVVTAAVQYCSRYPFHTGSEVVKFNGTPINFTGTTVAYGTQSDCPLNHSQFERQNIQVTLGYGGNTLFASIENNPDGLPNNPNGYYRAVSASYTTPWPVYGVSLVAANRYANVRPATARVERVAIRNTGDVSTTFSVTCTWSLGTGCTPSPSSVTLAAGDTTSVGVSLTTGALGSIGTLTVTAAGGGGSFPASATVSTELTAVAAPSTARGVTLPNASGVTERDLCVTIKAGNDAAMECGALRLAHALPGIRTKGKARTPSLVYNASLAEPLVSIPADVALGAGASGSATISATVVLTAPASVAGTSFSAGQWLASDWPANGEAQRLRSTFDGSGLATGMYRYRLEIRRSTDAVVDTAGGILLHVNRSRSPFHGGWWVAGLEQVIVNADGSLLWVGGDGSTRRYTLTSSCDWRAENIDRVDRIVCDGTGYARLLPNALRVVFDASGRHRFTVNRLADTTEFTYTAQQALASILVPPRSAGVAAASYTFHYGAAGFLDSVSAPGVSPSAPRRVRFTWVTGRAMLGGQSGGRVLSIRDPDSTLVQLGYADETASQGEYRPVRRTDRRNTPTLFAYGAGATLVSARTLAASSDTITQTFRAADGQGVAASPAASGRSVPLDSVATRLDGPRTDVLDLTTWWVNRLGAPVRVRNPMGAETKVVYDATWPGAASTTWGPTGLKTQAFLNARGLADSVKATSPYGGADAVTRTYWNATWDQPDSVRSPVGVVTSRSYDAVGNVLWEQLGSNTSRRTTFTYDPATRLLVKVTRGGVTGRDTLEYDPTLLNLRRTTSPMGRWTQRLADALGRDTLVTSSIDATRQTSERLTYDLADQVLESRTWGPAMPYTLAGSVLSTDLDTAAVLPETLVVRTAYDQEGNVTRLQKLALPNPRPWLNQCVDPVPNSQCVGVSSTDTGSVDVRSYDGLHRLKSQRLGSSGGRYTYDAAGNVTSHRTWNNQYVNHRYDAAGQRTMTIVPSRSFATEFCDNVPVGPLNSGTTCYVRFPFYTTSANTLTIPPDTARFVYDQAGLLRGAYNQLTRVDRSYHTSGALATDTLRFRDYAGSGFTLKYALAPVYDVGGRRTGLRTPTAADSIRYVYDADHGALATVWQGNAKVQLGYDVAGRQTSLQIGTASVTGVTETRTYDADDMLRRRVRTSTVLGTLVSDTLVYDLRDKALDVYTTSLAQEVGTLEYHTRYSALGAVLAQQKLRQEAAWDVEEFRTTAMGDVYRGRTFRKSGDNGFPTVSTYNQFGALLRREPVRDLSVPNVQQYRDSTWSQMDLAGNVQWTGSNNADYRSATPVSQTVSRSYFGADNRLRFQQRYSETASSGSNVRKGSWEEHWYDALGRKVLTRARRDTMCIATAGDGCGSYTERTIWDGDQILYEFRGPGDNNTTGAGFNTDVGSGYEQGKVGYVHAGGIDAPVALMDGRVPNYNWRGLAESSVWLDGTAADCALMTGFCTRIAWPGNTGVYQKPVPLDNGSTTIPAQWVGNLLANGAGSTGMAYRRNRFYDGATGQFNQQDPIGLAGGANSYGFAGGDPVSYSDPFGLCPEKPWECPFAKQVTDGKKPSDLEKPAEEPLVDPVAIATGGAAGLAKGLAKSEFLQLAGPARAIPQRVLQEFFGQGAKGAQARLASRTITPGVTKEMLLDYATRYARPIAEGTADPKKLTADAIATQTARLKLIGEALANWPK